MEKIYIEIPKGASSEKVVDIIEATCKKNNMLNELELNCKLKDARKELLSVMSPEEAQICHEIPLVSYPTGENNAWIVQAESGNGLYVVVDTQFFIECNWACAIVSSGLHEHVQEMSIACLACASVFRELRYREKFSNLIKDVDLLGKQEVFSESTGDVRRFSGIYAAHTLATFIIAHEFGHALCGHLGNYRRVHMGGHDLDIAMFLHNQEYEADARAIELISRFPLIDMSGLLTVIDFWFRFNMACEQFLSKANTNFLNQSTHPPSSFRRNTVMKLGKEIFMKKIMTEDNENIKEAAINAVQNVDSQFVTKFWEVVMATTLLFGSAYLKSKDSLLINIDRYAKTRTPDSAFALVKKIVEIVGAK